MRATIKQTSENRSFETKKRILETAERMAQSDGVVGLTVRQLANEAGVSPALIIQYFKSKDQLMRRVYEDNFKPVDTYLSEICDRTQDRSTKDIFEAAFDLFLAQDLKNPTLAIFVRTSMYAGACESEKDEVYCPVAGFTDALTRLLMRKIPDLSETQAKLATSCSLMLYNCGIRHVIRTSLSIEDAKAYFSERLAIMQSGINNQTAPY